MSGRFVPPWLLEKQQVRDGFDAAQARQDRATIPAADEATLAGYQTDIPNLECGHDPIAFQCFVSSGLHQGQRMYYHIPVDAETQKRRRAWKERERGLREEQEQHRRLKAANPNYGLTFEQIKHARECIAKWQQWDAEGTHPYKSQRQPPPPPMTVGDKVHLNWTPSGRKPK